MPPNNLIVFYPPKFKNHSSKSKHYFDLGNGLDCTRREVPVNTTLLRGSAAIFLVLNRIMPELCIFVAP